jgi:protease-4
VLQSVVNDTYAWFKNLVAERRKMSPAEVAAVSDGRIFSARQGVTLKLVDQLGVERDAVAWMEAERGVAKNLPVQDWKPTGPSGFALWSSAAFGADLLGFDSLANALRRAGSVEAAVKLDGLLAVWQPSHTDR